MIEALGPYRASLAQARRRRALKALLILTLAVFGLIAWSSYPAYRDQRNLLTQFERGEVGAERLARFGFACDESSCQIIGRGGNPIGPPIPIATPQPGEKPGFGPGGFGAPISPEDIARAIPDLIPQFRSDLALLEKRLTLRASLQSRARAAGVFWGVLFVVLATSTMVGAEWRWGVWRTLLTHEPRRGRILVAKLATVWTYVAVTLALVLLFTAGLDVIFRSISNVSTSGGPSAQAIARTAGKSLLSLEVYATLAAAATLIIRASFGGIAALALLLGDGLATNKWHQLRVALPTQQIARLLPQPIENFFGGGYVWWPRLTSGAVSCHQEPGGLSLCKEVPLPQIPQWRAAAVLLGWIAVATLIAWVAVRSRDVPV